MSKHKFENKLKKLGLKITPQRLELMSCLDKLKDSHPTFNEIMNEMIELSPHSISRSTLHTNLKTMEKLGVLVSFNHENETHYELNQDLHVNVIQNDGNIQDIKDPEVEEHLIIVKDLIQKKHGKIKKFTILAELY